MYNVNVCYHVQLNWLLCLYTTELDKDNKLNVLEEPNGFATAPSMISLNSQLEGVASDGQNVSIN